MFNYYGVDGWKSLRVDRKKMQNFNSQMPPFSILEEIDIVLQIGKGVNYLYKQRIVYKM